ncbi:MAG TPA: alpha/beta hydrolase [Vitreimonas sp.]|nr:alpha/beta hydrolase [Vitreimonas sp.]
MKNALILHGGPFREEYYDPAAPSMSNAHWLPWLQAQLLKNDIAAATPEIPLAYDRNWSVWKKEVERWEIGQDTILVGHSTGAGFWVKYLSIHPELKVDKVVLVAPWLDPDRTQTQDFFDDFEIDAHLVSRTAGITIFGSDNDESSVLETVTILRNGIEGIGYQEFPGYGHFILDDMKTEKFPELLQLIVE